MSAIGGAIRRGSITLASPASDPTRSPDQRRVSILKLPKGLGTVRGRRKSVEIAEEAKRAFDEANALNGRARESARAAALAHAKLTRNEWESRILKFLAAGNARLPDGGADGKSAGTLMKTWLAVQDELQAAEIKGVPLSESARSQMIKMNPAEKARSSASEAAKLAAQRAEEEYLKTKHGAKSRQAQEGREETAMQRANKLAVEARRLAREADEKRKEQEKLELQLREAQQREAAARWCGLGRYIGSHSRLGSDGEALPRAGPAAVFCGCFVSRGRVMPPEGRGGAPQRWTAADAAPSGFTRAPVGRTATGTPGVLTQGQGPSAAEPRPVVSIGPPAPAPRGPGSPALKPILR